MESGISDITPIKWLKTGKLVFFCPIKILFRKFLLNTVSILSPVIFQYFDPIYLGEYRVEYSVSESIETLYYLENCHCCHL